MNEKLKWNWLDKGIDICIILIFSVKNEVLIFSESEGYKITKSQTSKIISDHGRQIELLVAGDKKWPLGLC